MEHKPYGNGNSSLLHKKGNESEVVAELSTEDAEAITAAFDLLKRVYMEEEYTFELNEKIGALLKRMQLL